MSLYLKEVFISSSATQRGAKITLAKVGIEIIIFKIVIFEMEINKNY